MPSKISPELTKLVHFSVLADRQGVGGGGGGGVVTHFGLPSNFGATVEPLNAETFGTSE